MSAAATGRSRGLALLSLILGGIGVGLWLAATRTRLLSNIQVSNGFSWAIVVTFVIAGLIGMYSGVRAIRGGRGTTRILAVIGTLLSLWMTLLGVGFGLFILFPPQLHFFP